MSQFPLIADFYFCQTSEDILPCTKVRVSAIRRIGHNKFIADASDVHVIHVSRAGIRVESVENCYLFFPVRQRGYTFHEVHFPHKPLYMYQGSLKLLMFANRCIQSDAICCYKMSKQCCRKSRLKCNVPTHNMLDMNNSMLVKTF